VACLPLWKNENMLELSANPAGGGGGGGRDDVVGGAGGGLTSSGASAGAVHSSPIRSPAGRSLRYRDSDLIASGRPSAIGIRV
jgi:hypothetical protein